jgi:hypothetical protein
MSLHLFRPPTPAPPSSGGTESVRTDPPESGRPSGNLHIDQMRAVLVAARVRNEKLTTGQIETIEKFARASYYGVIEFHGLYGDARAWEALSISRKEPYIRDAATYLQDRVGYCLNSRCVNPLMPGEDEYCSTVCRLDHERG